MDYKNFSNFAKYLNNVYTLIWNTVLVFLALLFRIYLVLRNTVLMTTIFYKMKIFVFPS